MAARPDGQIAGPALIRRTIRTLERENAQAATSIIRRTALIGELERALGPERLVSRPDDETVERALKYIRELPGKKPKELAGALKVCDEHFRRTIVPKLERRGVRFGAFLPIAAVGTAGRLAATAPVGPGSAVEVSPPRGGESVDRSAAPVEARGTRPSRSRQ
jgi:anthranilate phosphoribosyltransferase